MAKATKRWKLGRGKLGVFASLIGSWKATASTPVGPVSCTRKFTSTLDDNYIQLNAEWEFSKGKYEELSLIGVNAAGEVVFWSFTSDGKDSAGKLADVSDLHAEAVGFEAQMPAGLGRMAYWPDEADGFFWVVESKTRKGWNRFVKHHYKPA